MKCEECDRQATWRNGDDSFTCALHRDGLTAVYIGTYRRQRLAKWAKNLSDKGTVRLMPGTYLHRALQSAYFGRNYFSDLRDNEQNASSLQKALILGLIEKKGKKYFITKEGNNAFYLLNKAHKTDVKLVNVPYKKSVEWSEHAQTYCW